MFVRAFAAVLLAIAAAPPAFAQDKTVTAFVAASMTNVANDLNAIFTRNTGIKVTPSYAASSALAQADRDTARRPTCSSPPTSRGWTTCRSAS